MNRVLNVFIKKHGPFKVDENHNLIESDFVKIYDLIESVGRFQLRQLREKNEKAREGLYKSAFAAGSTNNTAYEKYIEGVYQDIEQEITLYQQVQDKILKQV